jgi:hypothetical protein
MARNVRADRADGDLARAAVSEAFKLVRVEQLVKPSAADGQHRHCRGRLDHESDHIGLCWFGTVSGHVSVTPRFQMYADLHLLDESVGRNGWKWSEMVASYQDQRFRPRHSGNQRASLSRSTAVLGSRPHFF